MSRNSVEKPVCPECGEHLSVFLVEDEKTGEMKVSIGCEGVGDDEFELEIATGLTEDDLHTLVEGKRVNMVATLLKRESDSG